MPVVKDYFHYIQYFQQMLKDIFMMKQREKCKKSIVIYGYFFLRPHLDWLLHDVYEGKEFVDGVMKQESSVLERMAA